MTQVACRNPLPVHLTKYSRGSGSFQFGFSPGSLGPSLAFAGQGLQAQISHKRNVQTSRDSLTMSTVQVHSRH